MQKLRHAVWVVIGLNVALLVAVIFESFLLCRPFAFTWDKTIPGGVCGDSTTAYLAIAIVNLIIDLMVLVLPMPVLWSLQMPFRKKAAISGILGLGFVYVFTSFLPSLMLLLPVFLFSLSLRQCRLCPWLKPANSKVIVKHLHLYGCSYQVCLGSRALGLYLHHDPRPHLWRPGNHFGHSQRLLAHYAPTLQQVVWRRVPRGHLDQRKDNHGCQCLVQARR